MYTLGVGAGCQPDNQGTIVPNSVVQARIDANTITLK